MGDSPPWDEQPPKGSGEPPDPEFNFLGGGRLDADRVPDGDKPIVPTQKDPGLFVPLYVMTAFFAAVFIIVPFCFRRGPNKGIIRYSIMIAAFAMWLFWVTVYIAQMNPLLGPRMKNTTLAWIGHTWGDDPRPAPAEGEGFSEEGPPLEPEER